MFHSTSGKSGYQLHWEPTFHTISKEILKKIMIREEELRMSEEIQNKYTESDDLTHLRDVTLALQKQAIIESGVTIPMSDALNILHNARFLYQHDPTMNSITIYQRMDRSREGKVQMGCKIFEDIYVYDLESNRINLQKYITDLLAKEPLPIIIFAGSVTWPPFRQAVEWSNRLQETYSRKAHFIAIYLAEAHGIDEWPLGKKVCITKHKTIEERINVAKNFQTDYNFKLPILIDSIENTFDYHYGAWPERYYMFDETGRICKAGFPTTEFGYDRKEITQWLENSKCTPVVANW